jgi:hypothetical protein
MSVSLQSVMNGDSDNTEAGSLAGVLEKICELQAEKERLSGESKKNSEALASLEKIAVELMSASGLDGVRTAGKSWFLREFFSVSIPAAHKREAVEAAKAEGLGDELVSVNTSTLKSWLMERRGSEIASESLAEGTAFQGLITEFRELRLSSRSIG